MSGYGILDYEGMNQAIYRGATSNIVVDTQKMGIGIGVDQNGPSSNLHVVGNTRLEGDINMIHTSNTSSMKVNSNVVTEFPRSKKLIKYPRVALTSGQSGLGNGYTQDGYTVKVSNESSTSLASYAFNGKYGDNDVTGAYWYTGNLNTYNGTPTGGYYVGSVNLGSDGGRTATVSGDWIELELPNKIKLEYFKYFSQNDGVNGAQDGVLYARNTTNEDWTLVHSYTDALVPDQNTAYTFNVNSTNHYKIYALVLTRKTPANTGTGGVSVGELEFYGLPEYDPDADGVDVKVASYPNVPNTDWLEVYYDAKESSSYPGTGGTVLDLSGNGNNGTLGTGVGFDSTFQVFTFNGATTASISGTHGLGSGSIGAHSLSYWLKRTSQVGAYEYHAMIGTGGNTGGQTAIGINQDKILIAHNGGTVTSGKTVITDNTWIHVAVNYNGGTTNLPENHNLYINGIEQSLIGSGSGGNFSLVGNELTLGRFADGGNGITGSIANFRLFNRALTQDEAWQLYSYQKEYFGHGDLSMTLKAGRLGIGTSEPQAMLDVRGDIYGGCPVYFNVRCSSNAAAGIIPWNIITESKGGGFDNTTGTFITPLTGVYSFSYTIRERDNNASIYTYLVINGVEDTTLGRIYLRSNYAQSAITFLRFMNQGDTLAIDLNGGDMSSNYNQFSGQYISSV